MSLPALTKTDAAGYKSSSADETAELHALVVLDVLYLNNS